VDINIKTNNSSVK